ncbi:ATP-binding protein [Pedobacter ghigonis]|uniref:ATP-binding protein n=1 Tax=Pedobacter ghigonis TaxID=2730403 RepID=UPI00158937E9|nr:ATP-binding protein [Pedobacter ghigonis]
MINNYLQYLNGGGEMGKLTREFDWASTPLGRPDTWPHSLLTAVSIVLNSRFPMFIWWGNDLIQFYNDAYRPSLGNQGKHPAALGQRGEDCWQEIWPVIKPLIDQVLSGGESTWSEDQLIPIYRNNRLEDVYWTFSYSKLLDEQGAIAGVLVTCTETTKQITALREVNSAKQELEFAINAANLGTWDLNPLTNRFIGNERLKSWFGLEEDAEIALSSATEVIIEQDRERVIESIAKAMQFGSDDYDIEYTILNPLNPQPRLVRAVGKAIFNQEKEVVRFSGTLQDITKERDALKQLKDVHHGLELALDQSRLSKIAAQLGTFDMDLIQGTLEWDDRCRELFGISHHDEVSYERDFVNGLHPDDRARILNIIEDVFDKAKTDGKYDVEYRTVGAEDGRVRWVRAKGKTYFDASGIPSRFIGSVLDITEQKTDELRKNDFIGMVSHELKTPLTSLKGYIQILNHKAKINADNFAINALSKADIQIGKMSQLINGFLNVSRLEAGKISIDLKTVDLREIIEEVEEELKMISTTHLIGIIANERIMVQADRDKIGSVISNLLGNAIKYSPLGSQIEISCDTQDRFARVMVKDEGPGIKAQDRERLFERFYRVGGAESHTVPGFGIGLYLCAEIIARHNGEIGVTSEPGKGSTFYFLLPLK